MTSNPTRTAFKSCYCCTCGEGRSGELIWDAACRNHGAHGMRECKRHGLPAEKCDCGCGHNPQKTTDLMSGKQEEQP